MERIIATATAVPPHRMSCDETKQAMRQTFQLEPRRLEAVMALFDHAQVAQRYSVFPLDYLLQRRSLTQLSREYQEHALGLGRQVAQACLERAGLEASQVDMVLTVSCTGYMIPSLDTHLANQLGFRADVRRLPITELGCVAGAVALSRAREFLMAFPGAHALVVAVELSSLSFQQGDDSQANMVSCALFGDGAAAALLSSAEGPGVRILDTRSHLVAGTTDAMGFDLRDGGFHMVLSKSVPEILRGHVAPLIAQFLGSHGLALQDLEAVLLHPGGRKILEYLEEDLALDRLRTQPSWDILRDYGNLSSATIMFVLHEWLERRSLASGAYGLAAGFGPGLSAELLLLQWI